MTHYHRFRDRFAEAMEPRLYGIGYLDRLLATGQAGASERPPAPRRAQTRERGGAARAAAQAWRTLGAEGQAAFETWMRERGAGAGPPQAETGEP